MTDTTTDSAAFEAELAAMLHRRADDIEALVGDSPDRRWDQWRKLIVAMAAGILLVAGVAFVTSRPDDGADVAEIATVRDEAVDVVDLDLRGLEESDSEAAMSVAEPFSPIFMTIRHAHRNGQFFRYYESVIELAALANSRDATADYIDLVRIVGGRIVSVAEGRTFTWSGDGLERTEYAFGDPQAVADALDTGFVVNTFHLELAIDEIVAPSDLSGAASRRVFIGISLPPGFTKEDVEQDFLAMGPVVAFLNCTSRLYDYGPRLCGLMEEALLGTINRAGAIRFPLLDRPRSLDGGERLVTLDDLKAAAGE